MAVDPHDPSKLVAVWVDNDPSMPAITNNGDPVVDVEAAYSASTPARSGWRCWASRPTAWASRLDRAARPGDVRPDGPLRVRDRSQRGVRRQRQFLHPDRVPATPPTSPARPAVPWCCRSTTSRGQRRAGRRSPTTSTDPILRRRLRLGGGDLKVIYQWYARAAMTRRSTRR